MSRLLSKKVRLIRDVMFNYLNNDINKIKFNKIIYQSIFIILVK